ncbi:hypothetical protein EET67_20510 [Pseudaminobacter arsenicus]|uniref:Uncharacterized protein n=1 Tax=Borborobacter arsenicus TaxID=1851146 RepID=A0A432V150_9HYPH|nr:hypothetical protein [Pseudaminobacter arsenicus]RUM95906.1 hypothetical protein EET67_20510 [Pseudaminobacter arsenicus]
MSSRLPKGLNAPRDFSLHRPGRDAVSLHDRKLAAWALGVGASVPLAYPERDVRPHRGELADIDMRMAGPDHGRLPPLRRLFGWLGRLRGLPAGRKAAATTMSGADEDGIGTATRMPYIAGKPVT